MTLRPFEERDIEQLALIYKTCFASAYGADLPEKVALFTTAASASNTLVAVINDTIVGGGTYCSLTKGSEEREYTMRALRWARRKEDRKGRLRRFYEQNQQEYGGNVVLEFFDNEFTNGRRKISEKDVCLKDVFVEEDYQRRGIGRALVLERIRLAREIGATTIYVTCVESSPSVRIYERLEFTPLLRTGPSFQNGSGVVEMAMRLR